MARPVDAVQILEAINRHHKPTPVSQFESGFNDGLNQALWEITHAPTLTPPNEPLTLEQLREMEGQWIIIKAFDADISGIMPAFIKDQFATTLCELGSKAIVPDLCEAHFSFNEYGKTWIAYRRQPEGEA